MTRSWQMSSLRSRQATRVSHKAPYTISSDFIGKYDVDPALIAQSTFPLASYFTMNKSPKPTLFNVVEPNLTEELEKTLAINTLPEASVVIERASSKLVPPALLAHSQSDDCEFAILQNVKMTISNFIFIVFEFCIVANGLQICDWRAFQQKC